MLRMKASFASLVVLLGLLSSCSSDPRRPGARDSGVADDATPGDDTGPRPGFDSGTTFDGGPVDICNPACGPNEICGTMGDGDGFDDDCDGTVDEGCACGAVGVTRGCFAGPPDRRDVGSCADGVMNCSEFLTWGPCVGGSFPVAETCDGADNDCNGVADDGIADCSTAVECPGTQSAAPLNFHQLEGAPIYTGAATSWQWDVSCPPTVAPCPAPEDPNSRDTRIFFVQSGNYRARLTIVTETGDTIGCEWVIVVQGAGLRVELLWDTQGDANGDTDVDLHLHRKSVPAGTATGETDFFTDDDCYYANCKASSYGGGLRSRWAMSDTTDLSNCDDAPHGEGAQWTSLGACYNPRLDVDVINCTSSVTDPSNSTFCAPENINVDNPPLGEPFRIMVNYFSGGGILGPDIDTIPQVNVFCGGELRGSFGTDPLIYLRQSGASTENADNWLVADVIFFRDDCGEVDCLVNPLSIVQRGPAFGVPWSF